MGSNVKIVGGNVRAAIMAVRSAFRGIVLNTLEIEYSGSGGRCDVDVCANGGNEEVSDEQAQAATDLLDEVLLDIDRESWSQDDGGWGSLTFDNQTGGIQLNHNERDVRSIPERYALGENGRMVMTSAALAEDERAFQVLSDAISALRDLEAGFPSNELHRPVAEIIKDGLELLRAAGFTLDDGSTPASASSPGP